MKEEQIAQFREKLDQHYAWPAVYTFKFIVPTGAEQHVIARIPNHEAQFKSSKNGKYTSLTFQMMLPSAQAVIAVYQSVADIDGLIAL